MSRRNGQTARSSRSVGWRHHHHALGALRRSNTSVSETGTIIIMQYVKSHIGRWSVHSSSLLDVTLRRNNGPIRACVVCNVQRHLFFPCFAVFTLYCEVVAVAASRHTQHTSHQGETLLLACLIVVGRHKTRDRCGCSKRKESSKRPTSFYKEGRGAIFRRSSIDC